jgi:cellulose biosynthesis protein BcsQ
MKTSIFMVGGSKGGVDKSIVCAALVDYLSAIRNEKVYLIESDTSNPDVERTYLKAVDGTQRIPGAAFDLDSAEGWVNLIDAAEQYPDHHIVVNSAARNGPPTSACWPTVCAI